MQQMHKRLGNSTFYTTVGLYAVVAILVFLYSFTQVDLGLVLSRYPAVYQIQQSFQYIGYFNRPLSMWMYTGLLTLLFGFYFFFLRLANISTISKKQLWLTIIIVSGILTFAYNAFSYDIFNYIFDAKILTFYHQNPYIHKALDFPQDPMLSFMRWTHRTYPYGPVWLAISIPPSFLGMQFFVPTELLFKFLALGSFFGTVYYIGKILHKLSPENELFGVAFFALNPLILLESIVSSHNDIVTIFFAFFSLYMLIQKRYAFSSFLLLLSIGIKYITVFLLPIYATVFLLIHRKKTISWDTIWIYSMAFMLFGVIAATLRSNFQPWYLLNILPFVAVTKKKYYLLIPAIIASLFGLAEYIPYLRYGDWNPPVPTILLYLHSTAIILSVLLIIGYREFRLGKAKR